METLKSILVIAVFLFATTITQAQNIFSAVLNGDLAKVKELVEKAVNLPLVLRESDNIKFLSMINPQVNPQLVFDILIKPIADQQFSATATIGSGSSVFLKFKGKFESEGSCRKN